MFKCIYSHTLDDLLSSESDRFEYIFSPQSCFYTHLILSNHLLFCPTTFPCHSCYTCVVEISDAITGSSTHTGYVHFHDTVSVQPNSHHLLQVVSGFSTSVSCPAFLRMNYPCELISVKLP